VASVDLINGRASTGIERVREGLVRKPEGKEPFVRPKFIWKDKIKIGF
jgi:hypothetical protein